MPKKPELTANERMLLELLLEKRANLLNIWGEQIARFQREVEKRAGLDEGTIGSVYQLTQDGTFIEVQPDENPEEESE